MKKYLNIIVIGIVGIILGMPMAVDAAEVKFDCTDRKLASDGNYTETCTVSMTGNQMKLEEFSGTVTLGPGLSMGDVTSGSGWTATVNNNVITFVANDLGVSDSTINFGTFVVSIPADTKTEDCWVKFSPSDKTYAEVTQEVTVEQTTKTGASLPIIVLGSGIVIAGVVYYISRRNTRLFKI